MECKNKKIEVDGFVAYRSSYKRQKLECIITNDSRGKTLSINDGFTQFTIAFEPIEKYLK